VALSDAIRESTCFPSDRSEMRLRRTSSRFGGLGVYAVGRALADLDVLDTIVGIHRIEAARL
jgi:hypothetical protein